METVSAWAVEAYTGPGLRLGPMIGRAFRDNPGMLAVLGPDPELRERRAVRGLGLLAASVRAGGRIEVVRRGEEVVGASLFFGPGEYPPGLRARALMLVTGLSAGPGCALRFARLDAFQQAHHPRRPHWYLSILAAAPALQGRGIGSALLRALAARADADGRPCYLETDTEANVRLYMRHGFDVVGEHVLPELGGVRFWRMERPPG